ncbi:hypothetical protein [Paenibacillus sp. PDC88]|uniref:hypothetical protein n=1 Tax=Paenibacillus sp. PDC88 TaxID=1884375 RepID=UPI000895704A|nr:hypothetical protein [Paenibacillus sp. PDC88]SDW87418.1 hypothetical protein SAMN05518848_103222 [Paenibacillus sp. PDC88]
MELQRSKARTEPNILDLIPRAARIAAYGLISIAGALVIIAVVLGIIFFSGESTEFIYMNF